MSFHFVTILSLLLLFVSIFFGLVSSLVHIKLLKCEIALEITSKFGTWLSWQMVIAIDVGGNAFAICKPPTRIRKFTLCYARHTIVYRSKRTLHHFLYKKAYTLATRHHNQLKLRVENIFEPRSHQKYKSITMNKFVSINLWWCRISTNSPKIIISFRNVCVCVHVLSFRFNSFHKTEWTKL